MKKRVKLAKYRKILCPFLLIPWRRQERAINFADKDLT